MRRDFDPVEAFVVCTFAGIVIVGLAGLAGIVTALIL